ncbi:phage tail protein I [Pseudomonas corrugata]|uniref:Phage tail protein I n=1 Tax=Pseudomonas corrugata TaxID=47879 RepID=A0A7Y5Z2L6_9PSED|nr:phage tail protein I [Pseudomonas corrugata]NUT85905.1 phage tail protein I [Pseudomonas corrugata]HCD9834329.1 phage tail protein I [Pseudomonas aeruginosa]HCE0991936.1 phage tail protein I [Pseudomonas aeruginosa]HCE3944601.1 phage tail protein I [Pseudomonas aeruginosa]
MAARLLPTNASELERLAAEAFAQIERTPIPLRELWNPDTCPVELLPILAWSFSVDRWSQAWPVSAKRNAIKAAYFIHAHKGTIGALRRVVEPLGYLIEVREWWQEAPLGVPGTFRLLIGVLDTGITEAMYQELSWLIDDAKPLSRHLVGLAIGLEVRGTSYIGAASTDGEILTVYPYAPGPIEVSSSTLLFTGAEHSIDTMSVYP